MMRRRLTLVTSAVASARAPPCRRCAEGARAASRTTAPTGSAHSSSSICTPSVRSSSIVARASTSQALSLVRHRHDARRLDVELVADLADDLLEQILHRHDAARAAVLVDDDGDRGLRALHVAEHVEQALRLGHEEDVAPDARRASWSFAAAGSTRKSFA